MLGNFFEKIDLLGSKFHFYDGLSLYKRTVIGGILTFFLGIISISFIYIYGREILKKNNPNITISIQNDSIYEYIDLKKEKIIFAFRIEDYYGNYINVSNILYMKIYYHSFEPDNKGKYRAIIKDELVNYHICNDNDFYNENLTKYYGILFCGDLGEKKFGGYWDNPYMYYFEFQVYFCFNGSNYSINNNCTSIQTLNKLFNQEKPIYFSFYYPIIEFDPLSYNNPLRIHYKNYYYTINHKSQREDEFYLKKTILNDDKGYILNKFEKNYFWGIDKIISSYNFFSEEELTIENSSSKIYSLSLFNNVEKNYYSRHYTKFHHVIAIVSSLINLILNGCCFISHVIGESIRKLDTLNNFFEFEEEKDFLFIKKFNSHTLKNTKILSPLKTNKTQKIKKFLLINQFGTSIINENKKEDFFKIQNLTHQKKNDNKNKNVNYTDQSYGHLFCQRKSLPIMNSNVQKLDDNNFKKSKLTLKHIFLENIIIYVFFCCSNKKMYTKYFNIKHSNLLQYYYISLIQINRYLKFIQEYYFLKKAFLNEAQIQSLLFLKKINLTNKIDRDNISGNKKNLVVEENIINYYKSKLSSHDFSKIDKFLLTNLINDIKEQIIV